MGNNMLNDKPLFIPLKREHFEAFEDGEKSEEYRKPGDRWNSRTCYPGRAATLSLGYGKKRRLAARVDGFKLVKVTELAPKAQRDVQAIYGQIGLVACIGLKLEPITEA